MGLTEKGYTRRTYNDILNDKIQRAKELFGEDIDTSDLTPLGKFIRINAYDQAIAEEEIEQVYYARFPNTASGVSLDRLTVFAGITRNPASAAVYSVRFTGKAGYAIPLAFLVSTDTELTYWTTQECTIGEDGTCETEVSCTELGAVGNLSSASAICKMTNPDANVAAVIGLECITPGRNEESDADLRKRFSQAVSGSGSCNESAIRAALLRIPTVQYSAVISNNTDEEDGDGRPPHSFECYVMGGDDYEKEIAEAIFQKRPVGIQTVGDKAVTITDINGIERTINYSLTQNVIITVRVQIRKTTAFPDDGIALVKSAISKYIDALGISNPLILSALYGHIYAVTGVKEVLLLEQSTNGGSSYSTANVDIPAYGVAVCGDVTVEVIP